MSNKINNEDINNEDINNEDINNKVQIILRQTDC